MRYWIHRMLGCAVLALSLACVDQTDADTGKSILYVYDGAANKVLAYDNVSTIYDATAAGAANRTIDVSSLVSDFTLSWGGMALDVMNQRLFLVSTAGKVIRIHYAGTLNGIPSSDEYHTFTIQGLSGGVFGQASVDSEGTFYVTECDASNKSQVWRIPVTAQDGTSVSSGFVTAVSNDAGCRGVAVNGNQTVYAYYNSGDTININGTDYSGPRLRSGSPASGFQSDSNTIINKASSTENPTKLANYGCLAFDWVTNSGLLFVARQQATEPVLVFGAGDFSSIFEVVPSRILTGPTNGNLRVIAHAGTKDWLVGAEATDTANTAGAGTSVLWIWKGPSSADTPVSVNLDTSVKILGLALDGSN
jgi:hypothetical protein